MKRIAITLGDPAGIGPEVVEKALAAGALAEGFEAVLLGDCTGITPGVPSETSARVALTALDESVRLLKSGGVEAVVTGPIAKRPLQKIGFRFPGQTEYFADAWEVDEFGMLLSGNSLTVGLATIHEPLRRVSELLTIPAVVRIGELTARYLRRLGIFHPRIAVAGLNPHAGEGGAFGDEETRVIAPAIRALNELRIAKFTGPEVPDAVFRAAQLGAYDAVLAMYHDQGLIPLKLLDFDHAVNVTLGLPKPRVSPDHGTAFAIAGKGLADHRSMAAAIRLACRLCNGDSEPEPATWPG